MSARVNVVPFDFNIFLYMSADDIRRNYMCNECGLGYNSLAELRVIIFC